MDITNYRYKEFIQQDAETIEEYTTILFLVDPIKLNKDIEDCTLEQVEFIRQNLFVDEELPTVFEYVEGITEKDFMNMRIVDLFGKLNAIKEQIEHINDLEAKYLVPEHHNMKWEAVGGSDKIKRFGIIPMVDGLAGGDVLKWQSILELPYSTIFRKLMYDTTMGDLEHKMNGIKTKHN